MLHCLVYFSASTTPFDEQTLLDILQQSRSNNARLGITGVLFYVRGSIIQVLEGSQPLVESLYEQIARDPRHTNVSQVLSPPIPERLFGAWHMGYETLSRRQLTEIQTLVDLNAPPAEVLAAEPSILLKTLRVFYESNRYN